MEKCIFFGYTEGRGGKEKKKRGWDILPWYPAIIYEAIPISTGHQQRQDYSRLGGPDTPRNQPQTQGKKKKWKKKEANDPLHLRRRK